MMLPRTGLLHALLLACSLLLNPWSPAGQYRVATYNLDNYLLQPVGTRPAKSAAGQAKILETLLTLRADLLALQEIGGTNALLHLRDDLQTNGLHYPFWEMVTGFDTNIQLALLSRFPIVARHPHPNDSFLLMGRRFLVSRGFLEVDLQIRPDYRLTVLSAHLKSRRLVSYADETEMREQEARLLRRHVEARLRQDPQANLIVLGDFNDLKDSKSVRHLIGTGRWALLDTRPAERNGDDQPNPDPRYEPRRITWTHHYGKEDTYSRIDYILLSPGLAREWLPEETFVHTQANWGTASDHRPITATFLDQNQ